MLPKKNSNKPFLLTLFIFYIGFVYFGLHYALLMDAAKDQGIFGQALYPEEGQINAFSLISYAWTHIQSAPFNLKGISMVTALQVISIETFAFAIIAALNITHRNLVRQDAPGKEKGSAEWFKNFKWYNERFTDPYSKYEKKLDIPNNNIKVAEGLELSMDTRFTQRNLNVLAMGGSGTGKTYGYIKPNLAQMNCSYVITDPSGEIMQVMGIPLLEAGYTVKLFSTSDMKHSNCYNPMDYIYDEAGNVDQTKVSVLVSTFIKNAGDLQKNKGGGDPFWEKSSTAWMTFAVFFLAEFFPLENRNMYNILKLAQCGKADENSASSETVLDKMVKENQEKNPNAKCFESYKTFKLAPAKTANSILISIAVDLNAFSSDDVRNMTTTSYVCTRTKNGVIKEYIRDKAGNLIRDSKNLDLQILGNSKTALFVNIPQADTAHNFLVSMMYSQLFSVLYTTAEKICPNTYNIYDGRGDVIDSGFATEELARRHIEIFKNAEVKADAIDGVTRYFLASKEKDAPILPEFIGKRGKKYICEVYSEEVGKKLIQRYNKIPTLVYRSQKKIEQQKQKEREKFEKETAGMTPEERRAYIERKNDEDAAYLRDHPEDRKKQLKKGASFFNRPKVVEKPAYVKKGALRLPVHVRFLLDEFSNIGEIPNFDKMLSTMRKYEISCTIILQSLTQIKAQYKDIWETLVGNCDTIVFLGSSEMDTVKYMSEKLGKTTTRSMDTSQSKSAKSASLSYSYKKDGRDLLDPSEIAKLDNDYCIVVIRGLSPFYLHKLRFNRHPNYYKTGDANDNKKIGNKFLEDFFKCESKLTSDKNEAVKSEKIEQDKARESTTARKKNEKKEPVHDKDSLATNIGTTPNLVDDALKKASSVNAEDYEPEHSTVIHNQDFEFVNTPEEKAESEKENSEEENNEQPQKSAKKRGSRKTGESKGGEKREKKTTPPKLDPNIDPTANPFSNQPSHKPKTKKDTVGPESDVEFSKDDSWIFQ